MHAGVGRRCWAEWLVLGFGMPAGIAGVSKLLSLAPATQHGSVEARYVWSILAGVITEWLFVAAIWLLLKSRGRALADYGMSGIGNWKGWAFALLFAALAITSNLRFLPRMGIPIAYAFAPRGLHLLAAILMGTTAGFCEEFLFRGFLMNEFAEAGYRRTAQVLLPGISFGLSHLAYATHGFLAAFGIILPTAILGMMWGIAYLLAGRKLLPCFVAHFLNDFTALPWIGFLMFKGSLG